MLGSLYIVATPIGNLEDITLRAIRILSEADIILAEDTRVTRKLLDFVNSHSRQLTNFNLISYHQHSGEEKKLEILKYLMDGKNISLVTDAGTPGISDPGNELIEYLLSFQPELKVIPIPGASAIPTALSVSGFDSSKFLFLGFWPKKKVNNLLTLIRYVKVNIVFYESPHRIIRTLEILEKSFGKNAKIFIGRELTKMHETLYRGTLKDVKDRLYKEKIKGEIVVVIEF